MDKQKKWLRVPFNFSNWENGSIKTIRKDLDELEKLGATDIEFNITVRGFMLNIEMLAYAYREETEEEIQKRMEKELKAQKETEERELRELARLKLKYNK